MTSHGGSTESPALLTAGWTGAGIKRTVVSELRAQRGIALPLLVVNLAWCMKMVITTAFLGRLGELQLAGGSLGATFATAAGDAVLLGLSGGMEPICGQAYGAKNHRLLRRTLINGIVLLLVASLPLSFLWLNVDRILVRFGQQRDIAHLARKYVVFLLPDLAVMSFFYPLKAYLSSQAVILPTLFASVVSIALHIPFNVVLSRAKGLQGVAMASYLTDLSVVVMLGTYVVITEKRKRLEEEMNQSSEVGATARGCWRTKISSGWIKLLRLSGPCCLTTCLEWWCYEILILLTGRLQDAKRNVAVFAVLINFDYLLYSPMVSLSTCASTRVSNELGAGNVRAARASVYVSLGVSVFAGTLGGSAMVISRGHWPYLYSHDKDVVDEASKMLLLMAIVEVINFPLVVYGGVLRGTARPWLSIYANLGGFYSVALPLAVTMAFKLKLGLGGILLGLLVGTVTTVTLLGVFVACINWEVEAEKAKKLAGKVNSNMSNQMELVM